MEGGQFLTTYTSHFGWRRPPGGQEEVFRRFPGAGGLLGGWQEQDRAAPPVPGRQEREKQGHGRERKGGGRRVEDSSPVVLHCVLGLFEGPTRPYREACLKKEEKNRHPLCFRHLLRTIYGYSGPTNEADKLERESSCWSKGFVKR